MPAIRDFDLATIEKLGRDIYEQDQWAWKATDIVFAKRSEDERRADGMSGWITDRVDGKPRVRFVKQGAGGPEVLYDVVFEDGREGAYSVPADRTLKADEIAQLDARSLAIQGAARKCSPNYNTVALKDPSGDGWLVWALATTADPDLIIIGGHFRFTISADGKEVKQRDEMSKGCLRFSRKAMNVPTDGRLDSLIVNHLPSLTPVETHVFSNLTYALKLIVGTMDGRAWKVDGGHVANIDMDMPGFDGFAARVTAGLSERCKIIASTNDEPKKYVTGGDPKIILATESPGPFKKIEIESGYMAEGVMCGRLDIVPAPNDYKVVVAGYPLYILDIGMGHPQRFGALDMSEGRFRYRITDGPALTDDLAARLGKRLDGFQNAVQAKTVSLMSLDVSRGNLVETLYRLGHVADMTTGVRADFGHLELAERSAYVTGSSAANEPAYVLHPN